MPCALANSHNLSQSERPDSNVCLLSFMPGSRSDVQGCSNYIQLPVYSASEVGGWACGLRRWFTLLRVYPATFPHFSSSPRQDFGVSFPPADSEADIMRGGYGLKPSSEGKRVAFDGDSRTVSGGPFPVTGELVAGFWLWK